MNKYYKYLKLKHSWNDINCLTLLVLIYKQELGIDLSDIWQRAGRIDGTTNITKHWFYTYGAAYLINELKYWKKISLVNIQEYDFLVITDRTNRPIHFGSYISNNKYVHIVENSSVQIGTINDIMGCILH